jgi:hypothetical protein
MSRSITAFARAIATAAAIAMLLASPVAAAADEDLPGRVGRLADTAGAVYLATEERADDWIEAFRNFTVTSGDNLWVSGDGRAEIDYGGGQIRLAADTNVHVSRLDDRVLALFVAHGRVIVRVRMLDPGEAAQIDTPNTQIALTRPGLYRIEVAPDRTRTEVVVRQGEATVALAGAIQQVLPGQTAAVEGSDPDHADVRNGYAVDGFDTWSADRDRRYERSRSASYVSRQMIGYADLDDHGRWETTADYGPVWYPTSVVAGWAPYRYGRWSWVGGWGWTWVDEAPWGYAPFHYGRWVHVGNRWGWCPGAFVARPLWAPALVGWYGGPGWSFSASFGTPVYGWVPLGWGEPFVPWWRCSDRCWNNYNRPYAVNRAERPHAPPTRYVNWSAPGGVTAVPAAAFTGRLPVQRHAVSIRPSNVANAPVLGQAPMAAKPTIATVQGGRPPRGVAPVPAAAFRTKPLEIAPAAPSAVPPAVQRRATPAWGGTPAPSYRGATPPANRGATPPGTVTRAGETPAPSSAAPAGMPTASPPAHAARSPQAGSYQPGTWGAGSSLTPVPRAPAASAPPSSVPARNPSVSRPETRASTAAGPAMRGEPRPVAAPQRGGATSPSFVPPPSTGRSSAVPPSSAPPAVRAVPAPQVQAAPAPAAVAPSGPPPSGGERSVRGGGQAVPIRPGRDNAQDKPNPQLR